MDRVQMFHKLICGDLNTFKAKYERAKKERANNIETKEKQVRLKNSIEKARFEVKQLSLENNRATEVRSKLNDTIRQLKKEIADLERCQPPVAGSSQPAANLLSFGPQTTDCIGTRQISATISTKRELHCPLNNASSSQLFFIAVNNRIRERDINRELQNEFQSLEFRIKKLKIDNESTTFENMKLISEKKALAGRKFLLQLDVPE